MSSRLQFTNTKKWTQAWFRKLAPQHKLFWLYLNDSCDHAGFWDVDLDLVERYTKMHVDGDEALSVFKDKIKVINDDLWWLRDYCVIQSKTFLRSDESSPPRKSMVGLLMKYGVYEDYVANYNKTYPGDIKPLESLKDKDKEKYKLTDTGQEPVGDKEKEKDMEQSRIPCENRSKHQNDTSPSDNTLSNIEIDKDKFDEEMYRG